MLWVSHIAPTFSPITGVHDGKSRGLKSVERKSTDLTFRIAIPDHSRPARRFVIAAAYSGRFKLWGARVVRRSWPQAGSDPQSYSRDQEPHTKAICDEPVGFHGRRRSLSLDGTGIPPQSRSAGKTY